MTDATDTAHNADYIPNTTSTITQAVLTEGKTVLADGTLAPRCMTLFRCLQCDVEVIRDAYAGVVRHQHGKSLVTMTPVRLV